MLLHFLALPALRGCQLLSLRTGVVGSFTSLPEPLFAFTVCRELMFAGVSQ